jgi:hypothetical protein
MNISRKLEQIAIGINYYSLESTLVKVPASTVAVIKPSSIADIEAPHECAQIRLFRLSEEMKVTFHQDVCYEVHMIYSH